MDTIEPDDDGMFRVKIPRDMIREPTMNEILDSLRRTIRGEEQPKPAEPLEALKKEIVEWCNEHCKGRFNALSIYEMAFVEIDDALLFKLTWGGE